MALPRITMEGRVVADPELRFSPQGTAVVKMRLVASDRRKNESGEWEDADTLWMSVTAFKQLAENVAESIVKGDLVVVTGKIRTDEWTTEGGEKRTAVSMIADTVSASLQFRTIAHGAGYQSRSTGATAPAASAASTSDPWASPSSQADADPPF